MAETMEEPYRWFNFFWEDPGTIMGDVSVEYRVLTQGYLQEADLWNDSAILRTGRASVRDWNGIMYNVLSPAPEWTLKRGPLNIGDDIPFMNHDRMRSYSATAHPRYTATTPPISRQASQPLPSRSQSRNTINTKLQRYISQQPQSRPLNPDASFLPSWDERASTPPRRETFTQAEGPEERVSVKYPPSPHELETMERSFYHGYIYLPLDIDTHEIRILSVNMGRYSGITCSMEYVSLIDPGPYMALSYHWGDSSHSEKLYIGSNTVMVTANLYRALQAILAARQRLGRDSSQPVRLWIDAICINQKDHQERSQQVRSMSQIYSQADRVIAWVGPSVGKKLSSKNIIDELQSLPNLGKEPTLSPTQLESAAVFFSEPYWRRVWIIQEITVALKVTVLYGDCIFQWDDVVAFLSRLRKMENTCSQTQYKTFLEAVHLLDFRDKYAGPVGVGLLEAMTWSRSALATEPRDKIFALLGLCHDAPRYIQVPNYKQSLESIITMMSKAMMARYRSLDLICLKGVGRLLQQNIDLPTWSPNWPNLWSGTLTLQEQHLIQNLNTLAVGSENPIMEGSTNQALKVFASRVGSIKSIATSMTASPWPLEPGDKTWLMETKNLRTKMPALANASEEVVNLSQVIWKTLTMHDHTTDLVEWTGMACFEHLWRPEGRGAIEDLKLIQWIDDNAGFKIGSWTLREWSQVASKMEQKKSIPGQPVEGPDMIAHIEKLVLMGFPKDHALDVINHYDFDLERAIIYLQSYYESLNRSSSPLALREKQQAVQPQDIAKEGYAAEELNVFLSKFHRVLDSGMRLAEMDYEVLPVAMVHPNAQPNDEVFYIQGCSIPVILRKQPMVDQSSYGVIGAAYLYDDLREEFLSKKPDDPAAFPKRISLC